MASPSKAYAARESDLASADSDSTLERNTAAEPGESELHREPPIRTISLVKELARDGVLLSP